MCNELILNVHLIMHLSDNYVLSSNSCQVHTIIHFCIL